MFFSDSSQESSSSVGCEKSCNRSGEAPARNAREAARLFAAVGEPVPSLVLDDGLTPGGAGSTVVGLLGEDPVCLREGRIPFVEVQAAVSADFTALPDAARA